MAGGGVGGHDPGGRLRLGSGANLGGCGFAGGSRTSEQRDPAIALDYCHLELAADGVDARVFHDVHVDVVTWPRPSVTRVTLPAAS